MNISIQKPFSITEIGKRINNEDSIYPNNESVSANDRLFLVCDGVGGSNKGEVASSVACESIQNYFRSFLDTEREFSPDFIEKAVRYAEINFDEYLKQNPQAKGMATTLCLLYISSEGIYIAHAGDSRIYQIREGKIIFQTEDHSLINSLVKNGQVLPEDANRHPQKNVIYKAIQGSFYPVEIDIVKIKDIRSGDQFLMCTDGIIETLSDNEICQILSENGSSESKLNKIKELCKDTSRDNYSAYLIPIQEVQYSSILRQVITSFFYAFV